MSSKFLLVGCYTKPPYVDKPNKNSLYIIKLDKEAGKLSIITQYDEIQNASYISKFDDHVWITTEDARSSITQCKIHNFQSRSVDSGGLIESTPLLEFEKTIEFEDPGACYVSSDLLKDGSYLVSLACYDSGVIKTFKSIGNDLQEEDKLQLISSKGDKSNERQDGPHAHCVIKWKGLNNSLAVVDLGSDMVYQVDISSLNLTLNTENHFKCPSNSGPRHLLFHPYHKTAFLLCELSNELLILSTNINGKLSLLHTVPLTGYDNTIISDPESDIQNAAHLALSKNGKYILCSNRGKVNNIIMFKINENDNFNLDFVDMIEAKGIFPRFFDIIDDEFLIIANQKSDNLVVYRMNDYCIDKEPSSILNIPAPICIQQL